MIALTTLLSDISPFTGMVLACLLGGVLSVCVAAIFALNAKKHWVPLLVSYAIGALLAAVFLEILPHAIETSPNIEAMTATMLFGVLLFFTLEKLVLWRHCHGEHCEMHAMHDEAHCPELHPEQQAGKKPQGAIKFKLPQAQPAQVVGHHHAHAHDGGRSGLMIMVGDTFHNFVDGILICAAFMVDMQVGLVTALAIIAHEIPQEVGDFLILLHSGYSKKKAFLFNIGSSLATLAGGLLAYLALNLVQQWVPYILSLAAASMLYVAVADLIPGLHKRTALRDTLSQLLLIVLGVASVAVTKWLVEG
ncbi:MULTISPECIES: ZIP family metal transporter [unclassified Methylophilus]|jgi:zinc and cadmium transporter|uniref:ZIP family metal transporter n=1 Tax=unclassified Methylophilus TaxID=2630143 RepID=UPI000648D265|nr:MULTISPECIES: ZIP family metal transporter [unclassified Methylophilus]HCU85200.1 ZIP family metal transporter [Methylophilus sp.]